MTDEELVKHCMCGCMYLEAECPNCNKVTDADRIEALTAERDEWKSLAEAAIKDDASKNIYYAELNAKLAKAVEGLRFYAAGFWHDNYPGGVVHEVNGVAHLDYGQKAQATLAEIEGSDAP